MTTIKATKNTLLCASTLLLAVLALMTFATSANAAFTRPVLGEITGTPSGPFGPKLRENESGGGIAVEPAEVASEKEDSVWVGAGAELDEFSPAYETTRSAKPLPPIRSRRCREPRDRTREREKYRESNSHYVAVDNSPPGSLVDPSACGAMPLARVNALCM